MRLKRLVTPDEISKFGFIAPYEYLTNYYIKKLPENITIYLFGTLSIEVHTPRAKLKSDTLVKRYVKDLLDANLAISSN